MAANIRSVRVCRQKMYASNAYAEHRLILPVSIKLVPHLLITAMSVNGITLFVVSIIYVPPNPTTYAMNHNSDTNSTQIQIELTNDCSDCC